MKNLILAWRNLWRNRRRTLITSTSVFFAVLFALFFRSLQLGSYAYMYKNAIESYTGYLQVQQKDFWDEKIVDNSFHLNDTLNQRIVDDKNVITTIPRFESFALASSGPQTKGVLVMGVNPEKEEYLSKINEKLVKYRLSPRAIEGIKDEPEIPDKVKEITALYENTAYSNSGRLQLDLGISDKDSASIMPLIRKHAHVENGYITIGQPGALVGDNLAQYLELGIGDSIVLISQGYHATTAAGKFPIRGIVKLPMPDLDNKIVYLPLDICQTLYNAPGNITSLALHINDNSDKAIAGTKERMKDIVSDPLRIIDWKEMNQLLVNQLDADNKSGMIMIGILYLVIAFGVFGTVLMMTAERRREFGVLVAIGMQKKKLASIISYEMFYIGLLGILAGSAVAILIVLYGVDHPIVFKGETAKMWEDYGFEPIMAFQGINFYFLWQMLIVAIMVILSLIYPVTKVFNLKVVNALRA